MAHELSKMMKLTGTQDSWVQPSMLILSQTTCLTDSHESPWSSVQTLSQKGRKLCKQGVCKPCPRMANNQQAC